MADAPQAVPRVIVVGVGALGSHVVLFGRNRPVKFTVIDFDRVESKNTMSQFHAKPGIGKNKAQALQQAVQGLYGLKIDAVPHELQDTNVEALLGGANLVLDCVDNAPTRERIQRFVRERSIPCLHGALAADGAFARIVWDPLFVADEAADGAATCEDGAHLPFVGFVAAQLAAVVGGFLARGEQRSLHLHPHGVVPVG